MPGHRIYPTNTASVYPPYVFAAENKLRQHVASIHNGSPHISEIHTELFPQ
jgi:hypothetical protein